MKDQKIQRLREKLGISNQEHGQITESVLGENLQNKISHHADAGGNFVSAPPGTEAVGAGGNFVSAPPGTQSVKH